MATYLPNVKDYVPEMKAYTPDFKFLSDALDERQDRYNRTTKQLNNLYGDVVHADLSRKDNQAVRDSYSEQLAPKIQQISGLDFSLAQNVQAAKGLFKPFYEDEHIVRDIVYTKQYKDQMAKANTFKNSVVDKERSRYWDDGVEYMNFMMKDFQEKSREESMKVPLPEYFENPNLYERAQEILRTGGPDGKGLKATDMFVDQTGQFIVTQENGVALLNQPTGEMVDNPDFDPKKKESASNPKQIPGMYNPAANLVVQSVSDDPIVQQGYMIKAYNDARKYWEAKAKETGQPVEIFKREWAQQEIEKFNQLTGNIIAEENKELNSTRKELTSWEEYSKQAPLIEGSEEYQKWFMAMTKGETIERGIDKLETKRNDILNNINEEDIDALLNRGYAAYVSSKLQTDIFTAARDYADATSSRSFEESKIYIEKLRARNNENLERLKRQWKLNDEIQKTLMEIEKASKVPVPVPGDSRENIQKHGTQIEQNEQGELRAHQDINTRMIQTIAAFYMSMADDINTATNLENMADYRITDTNREIGEVKTSGIFIPNLNSNKLQFYRWEDATEALMANPELLLYHYNYVQSINDDPDKASSYKNIERAQLRANISEMIDDVERRNTKLKLVQELQTKVYKNVLATMDVEDIRAGLGRENITDWNIELFDDNGNFKTTKELHDQKIKEVESHLQKTLPKSLPSTQEIYNMYFKNGSWQTNDGVGDGYNPNSPVSTAELQRAAACRSCPTGISQQGLYAGYYHGMIKDAARELNQNPALFFARYYSEPKTVNDKIVLTKKSGSKEDVYTDIANDYLDFGSFKQVIDKVKNKMSEEMNKETAIPFETTFDFNSFYYGNETTGDASIAPIIPYRYDAGTKDKYVNAELDRFFGAFDGLPSGSIMMGEGDLGSAFSLEIDENSRRVAEMVLQQIRADRNFDPGTGKETSGTPGYRLEYSTVGGGENAEGNWAMYKYILDADYAAKIAKDLDAQGLGGKIKDQTITVFFNKDLFKSPLDPEAQYQSFVKSMILNPNNQGTATLENPNGGVIHFEMTGNTVYQKYAYYKYNPVTGNMELGSFTTQPLVNAQNGMPISDELIDKFYSEQRRRLEEVANTNLQAQKNHKLTQSSADTEEDSEN